MKITDDIGREITLDKVPQRIVSLVPSLTETLAGLGLGDRLVGVTRFCKYPEPLVEKLPKIGGPKRVKIDTIIELKPDIIFAVKEENNREQILKLAEQIPVVVFDINTFDDSLAMIKMLGSIFYIEKSANQKIKKIKDKITQLSKVSRRRRAVYLIWKKPWMAAGSNTFIGSMMKLLGYDNVISGRYPEIDFPVMEQAETLLLATEPYPFSEKEQIELQNRFPDKKVDIVDGELFAWYGTHILNVKFS